MICWIGCLAVCHQKVKLARMNMNCRHRRRKPTTKRTQRRQNTWLITCLQLYLIYRFLAWQPIHLFFTTQTISNHIFSRLRWLCPRDVGEPPQTPLVNHPNFAPRVAPWPVAISGPEKSAQALVKETRLGHRDRDLDWGDSTRDWKIIKD